MHRWSIFQPDYIAGTAVVQQHMLSPGSHEGHAWDDWIVVSRLSYLHGTDLIQMGSEGGGKRSGHVLHNHRAGAMRGELT